MIDRRMRKKTNKRVTYHLISFMLRGRCIVCFSLFYFAEAFVLILSVQKMTASGDTFFDEAILVQTVDSDSSAGSDVNMANGEQLASRNDALNAALGLNPSTVTSTTGVVPDSSPDIEMTTSDSKDVIAEVTRDLILIPVKDSPYCGAILRDGIGFCIRQNCSTHARSPKKITIH